MDLGLKGQRVLLVGSTKGTAREIARLFAEEGCRLCLTSRNAEDLAETEAEIKAMGAETVSVVGDVLDPAAAERFVQAAVDAFGGIDILMHTPGRSVIYPIETTTDEVYRESWELNFLAPARMVRTVLPVMRAQRSGSIVILGAASGKQPNFQRSPSNSAKSALMGFIRTIAAEVGPDGIRINNVAPGRASTERWLAACRKQAEARGISLEQLLEEEASVLDLRRIAEPIEVARVAVFIASPAASYVTGQNISVDGGMVKAII